MSTTRDTACILPQQQSSIKTVVLRLGRLFFGYHSKTNPPGWPAVVLVVMILLATLLAKWLANG